MNRIIIFILITITALAATSCQKTQNPDTAQVVDREGSPITLPSKVERIISLGPSNTEILVALGFADQIIAADAFSRDVEGLPQNIPLFNMLIPDGERIIQLEPDVIIATGMSRVGGTDPFKTVSDVGISVVMIPTSTSIAGIQEDIRFIAEVTGAVEKGNAVIAEMNKTINAVAEIGQTITDRKTVYFEISAESNGLYSFGNDVYLNEMLEIIGAVNILADMKQWVAVSEEAILDRNPDVILTCNDAIVNSVDAIMSRPGWNTVTAVKNGDVYAIDAVASGRPSHRIVKPLLEMAKAVYPDVF